MSRSDDGSGGRSSEERRLLDVGGVLVPGVAAPLGHLQSLPDLVALEYRSVAALEQLGLEGRGHRRPDLLRRGPDVAEEDRLAILAGADRLLGEIDIHPSGKREGHDQHRRRQVVGPDLGMDPRLEVAVPAQHRGRHQRVLVHHLGDDVGQRAAVADAGGAAVADDVEAESVEVGQEARPLQVVGHHPGSGGEAALDPGSGLEPSLHRLLRHEPGADHDRRVAGVGAARDRGDDHGAVVQLDVIALEHALHHRRRVGVHRRGGRLGPVLADGDVGAALAHPAGVRALGQLLPRRRHGRAHQSREAHDEVALQLLQRDAVLRALGPGEARHDAREIQLQRGAEDRIGCGVGAEESLLLAVPLHPLHESRGSVRCAPGSAASPRPPERSPWSRRTPGPCWRWWRGRPGRDWRGPARRTRRTCPPRPSSGGSGSR